MQHRTINRRCMISYIPTKDELQKAISEAVETAVTKQLPEIISKATRKPYYTIDEACKILSVTRRHLQYLRDTDQISFVQHGRKIYFKAEDLDEFFNRNYIDNRCDG